MLRGGLSGVSAGLGRPKPLPVVGTAGCGRVLGAQRPEEEHVFLEQRWLPRDDMVAAA